MTDDLTLKINEIYASIQGESSWVGLPCTFVRLTACDLRCTYCDTAYAFYEGKPLSLQVILETVRGYKNKLVEITGGEPLLQKNSLPLMRMLCDEGFTVLLETGGHRDIAPVDQRVRKIMDFKTPSSGESLKNLWSNAHHLQPFDEVKFVVGDRGDYVWALEKIDTYRLEQKCVILFSPIWGKLEPQELVQWILDSKRNFRFQIQLHKILWGEKRGV